MSNFVAVHSGGPMKPGIWSDFVNKFLTDESFENYWDQWKFALKSVKLLGKFLRSVKIFGKFFRLVNILGKFFRSVKILGQFLRSVRFCRQIFRSVKILIERSDFVDKFLIGGSSIRSVEISIDRSWSEIPRKIFSCTRVTDTEKWVTEIFFFAHRSCETGCTTTQMTVLLRFMALFEHWNYRSL